MKVVTLIVAGVAAVSAASANHHRHVHRHVGKQPHRRAPDVVEYVKGPEVVVYELDGEVIPADEVAAGIKNGLYVLVNQPSATPKNTPAAFYKTFGSTSVVTTSITSSPPSSTLVVPSSSSPTSSSTSTSSTSTSTSSTSTSTSSTSTSTSSTSTSSTSTSTSTTPIPTSEAPIFYAAAVSSTSSQPKAAATTYSLNTGSKSSSSGSGSSSSGSSSSSSSSSSSGSAGIDTPFPSGTLDCGTFPSDYGPIALNYLGLGGWSGIQQVPSYSLTDTAISYIVSATSGGCTANSFCSYACPAGYQKSQWPNAQGATGQSIGGIYCNANNKLELSNSKFNTLCIKGTGGVYASNKLSNVVSICRTDYPGDEGETIPVELAAGSTEPLTCPDANTYYSWQGKSTSAQYYLNPSGYGREKACKWGSAGTNLGNWAPVNLGVGKGASGQTFISIFQNAPTNTDGCLDFNVKITGGVSCECSYRNCKFYQDGVQTANGCTAMVTGTATYEFSSS